MCERYQQDRMAVGSTESEEKQQKLEERAAENQAEDEVEVTSMKQWSCRINEQGSDGEEVSHEDYQHRADIASKNMAANQQKERTIHIGESDRWVDSRSRAAIRPVHM